VCFLVDPWLDPFERYKVDFIGTAISHITLTGFDERISSEKLIQNGDTNSVCRNGYMMVSFIGAKANSSDQVVRQN
jgi:hypothetical protein